VAGAHPNPGTVVKPAATRVLRARRWRWQVWALIADTGHPYAPYTGLWTVVSRHRTRRGAQRGLHDFLRAVS
jgi:hypothetical protein